MRILGLRQLAALALCLVPLATIAAGEDGAIEIGSHKQLFLDDTLVESMSGITFTMNPPAKMPGPILQTDAPWEKAGDAQIGLYCSILKDQGTIRLWYDIRYGDDLYVAYAESTDGIHFEKPVLGLHAVNGSKENNIVIPSRVGGCAVWIDPRAPEDQRYRGQTKGYNKPHAHQLYSYHSPDGIHWTQWRHEDIGDCDTQSIAFWDGRVGRYVLYTRHNPDEGTPSRSRLVRRLESDDLQDWENEVVVLQADAVDDATYETPTPKPPVDYYGAAVFRYPDEGGPYIILSQPYWHFQRRPEGMRWGPTGVEQPKYGENLGPATIDVRLNASRDGVHFQRLGERRPFLAPGLAGNFDSKMIWALPNPIPMGDEIWVYYAATNLDHDGYVDPAAEEELSGIGLARMRLDGWVSADAPYTGGTLITRPLRFTGNRLEVNMDAGGGGSLQVEMLDVAGAPIPGYTRSEATLLTGNATRMPVTWGENGDVGAIAGTPVRLRFTIRDCKLYAFRFADTVS